MAAPTFPTSTAHPAGWYRSPDGSGASWWWDGTRWVAPASAVDPSGTTTDLRPVPTPWTAPTVGFPDVVAPVDGAARYHDLRGLAVAARAGVLTGALGLAVTAFATWSARADLASAANQGDLDDAASRLTSATLLGLGALLVGAALFVPWFHRAHANLAALRARRSYGSGWAIGGWFVPVLSLVRPCQIALDVHRGSDPDVWRAPGPRPGGGLVAMWWGLWAGGSALALIASRASSPTPDAAALRTTLAVVAFAALLQLASALPVLCVIGQVTRDQARRASHFGLGR